MKNELIKKSLPHLIAIVIFLLVAILFCKPALEGNVLGQDDILGWKGMAQNGFDYKAKTGHFPLWNPNLFGGMPNYLIVMDGKSVLPDMTAIFSLGLPQPVNFFFIAALCFYILCMALRLKPVVGIFGGLAFSFCSFHPAIIIAGHVTQMYAISYIPLLLAGIILVYEKKYWIGLAVATLGTYMQVAANHPQISYYFFIIAFAITIGYIVDWVRKKEFKHAGIALALVAVAAIVGVMANSLSYLVTTEYSKATMRGGKSVSINGDKVEAVKTTGLDTSYAFQYSVSKPEPLVIFMPQAMGGTSRDVMGEEHSSNVVKKLTDLGVPEASAQQAAVNMPRYWGGLEFAGNLTYIGVLVFLLALIGFVVIRHPLRWALLAVSLLSVIMSWGRFFPGFNVFLFEHLPLYNKFRAPSMSLVMTEICLPIIAVLAAQRLFFTAEGKELLKKDFRIILYTVGGLVALLGLFYLMMSYTSPLDGRLLAQFTDKDGNNTIGNAIGAGLKAERRAIFGGQLLRTVGFIILLLGMLWVYLKNYLKPVVIVSILALINLIDLVVIDRHFLNDESFHSRDELAAMVTKTPLDEQILQDKSLSYRVFNNTSEEFSSSDAHFPAFHKTIGGYHPAKLRIYQDIMERYLYGDPNLQVLNMLNTKYVIREDPASRQRQVQVNPGAYGPVWLVKGIKTVKNDADALQAIGSSDLKDTVVIDLSIASNIPAPQWDSTASIQLTKFDNDAVNYSFTSSTPQFAVFSEIYYPYGWNAYIDGKKVEYVKADYALRGLAIPAGKHEIRFVFEPETYKKGLTIAYAGSWLVLLLTLGGFFMAWWTSRKKEKAALK